MAVYEIDPIADSRWEEFVSQHPSASIFHTAAWLQAIHTTYGYRPVVFTTSNPNQPLRNGVPFCEVKSWLTGTRLVSIPFADHCEPLTDGPEDLDEILEHVQRSFSSRKWRYVELRPLHPPSTLLLDTFTHHADYAFHTLDVRPEVDVLMRNFHRTSIRKVLRRAQREHVTIQSGQSDLLLKTFCTMRLITRRRQHLPPQPTAWYRALMRSFGKDLEISVAYVEGKPVSGLLSIRLKQTLFLKYGGSNSEFHATGCIPYLYWHAIERAKSEGAEMVDFGRSEITAKSLITFKDRWGAMNSPLIYYRLQKSSKLPTANGLGAEFAKRVFSVLPDSCLSAAGRILYRHIG